MRCLELHRDDVAIVDVGKFVGDNAFELASVKQLNEFLRDDHGSVSAATDRERIRNAHTGDFQRRFLHLLLSTDALNELMNLCVLGLRQVFGPDTP